MGHGPATEWKENKALEKKKSRLGIFLFFIYTVVYAGFILINVVDNRIMQLALGSFNLAIVYGFGLIFLAILFAVFYNHICTRSEKLLEGED